ncbi:hypothetical protein UlMin_008557 [Ulmus minor]
MATNKNSKTTSPSNSSEIVPTIDDLLIQILVKLPLKSLTRFKSVSKHWLSLISDPDFSRRRKPISGLFLERLSSFPKGKIPEYNLLDLNQTSNPGISPTQSLTFINVPSGIKILHSCNGLFLCSPKDIRKRFEFYVYNPTTKNYTILPPLPDRSVLVLGFSLAFDPSKSPNYKVLCVFATTVSDDNYHTQIEIYSSKTRTWRRLSGDAFLANCETQFANGVFWNGAVHWFSPVEPHLYFNVDQERLSQMPMPPLPDDYFDEKGFRYFGESGGHLHLIYYFYDLYPAKSHLDIYEMEIDYSSWFIKFRVDLSEFPTRFPEINQPDYDDNLYSILYIVHGVDDEQSYALIRILGKVIKYNFKSRRFEKLCDIEADEGRLYLSLHTHAHQFIESLALV